MSDLPAAPPATGPLASIGADEAPAAAPGEGRWAPCYAERLPLIDHLGTVDWGDLDPDPEASAAWRAPFGPAEDAPVRVRDMMIAGPRGPIPVRIYSPADGEPSGAGLVWCHGGAFLAGGLDMPEADPRGLVRRCGGVVVSVDYRLCQDGAHHPIPHDDAYAAYRWTREQAASLGIDPGRLALGGASAGACLAGTVALHARDDGCPPAKVLLAYPVAHAELPAPSPELAALLPLVPIALRFPPAVMSAMNGNYIGGDPSLADGYAFPGHAADLAGFPATYIENCEFDDLRASGERFAEQLVAAGVEVEQALAAGVPHGHLNAVGSALTFASLDRFAARLP